VVCPRARPGARPDEFARRSRRRLERRSEPGYRGRGPADCAGGFGSARRRPNSDTRPARRRTSGTGPPGGAAGIRQPGHDVPGLGRGCYRTRGGPGVSEPDRLTARGMPCVGPADGSRHGFRRIRSSSTAVINTARSSRHAFAVLDDDACCHETSCEAAEYTIGLTLWWILSHARS
jgi:hypothetical protein